MVETLDNPTSSNPYDDFEDDDFSWAPKTEPAAPANVSEHVKTNTGPVIDPPRKSGNPYDDFDDDAIDFQPSVNTSWFKPYADRVSQTNARKAARELTKRTPQDLPAADPQEASFWGALEHGLGNRNIEAYADTLDHLADMSADPSYQQSYRDWAASLRKSVAEDKSAYKPVYQSFKQINGLSNAWGYVKEVAGEQVGIMAPSIAGAAAGGYLGRKAGGRVGAIAGAGVGALSGMAHHHVSEMRRALQREEIDGPQLTEYTNYGAAVLSGLDLAFPVVAGLKWGGAARAEVSKRIALQLAKGGALKTPAEFIKRFGKDLIRDIALLEVPTEIAQEAVTEFVPTKVAGKEITDEQVNRFLTEVVPEIAIRTTIGAGVVSGPGTALQVSRDISAAREQLPKVVRGPSEETPEQQQAVAREGKEDQVQPSEPMEGSFRDILRRVDEQEAAEAAQQAAPEEIAGAPAVEPQPSAPPEAAPPLEEPAPQQTPPAPEELQQAEAETVAPQIQEYDQEFGEPVLSAAYARLDTAEKAEVIKRTARGEDVADLLEELAIRKEDRPTVAALAVKRGLTDEQVSQVRQMIADQSPELVAGFDDLVARIPQRRSRQSQAPLAAQSARLPAGEQEKVSRYTERLAESVSSPAAYEATLAEARRTLAPATFQAVAQRVLGTDQAFRSPAEAAGRLRALQQAQAPASILSDPPSFEQMALRRMFADILNSRTPRSQWAEQLGVSEAELEPLIEEAMSKNWLRRDRDGNIRRAPKSQRQGNIAAMAIADRLPDNIPGQGQVAKTDEAIDRAEILQAAVDKAASQILPERVRVKVVEKIKVGRQKKEDALLAIRAFHGSPHSFDGFDNARIGSGEGTAMEGHGFYLSDSQKEGRTYQIQLGAEQTTVDGVAVGDDLDLQQFTAAKIAGEDSFGRTIDEIVAGQEEAVRRARETTGPRREQNIADAETLLAKAKRVRDGNVKPGGSLYEVEIDAEPENFLELARPLAEQPEVMAAIRSVFGDVDIALETLLGQDAYSLLSETLGSDQLASEALSRTGLAGSSYTSADATNYVVFDGSLLKITKKNGEPVSDQERQDVVDQMFALRGFYSPAIRAAEQLNQKKGTGEQFWKQITKAPGVRKDELEWMGLEEFLAGKKSVTKDEVLDFMRAHQVKLDERMLGDSQDIAGDVATAPVTIDRLRQVMRMDEDELPDAYTDIQELTLDGRRIYVASSAEHREGQINDWVFAEPGESPLLAQNRGQAMHMAEGILRSGTDGETRFHGHKIPGGENYRELLIRLPELGERDLTPEEKARVDQIDAALKESPDQVALRNERDALIQKANPQYESRHFHDQEIVHIRVDDRTGPNGERVLFINEVQSDLHQKGRREGYGALTKEERDRLSDEYQELRANPWGEEVGERIAELRALLSEQRTRVPDAPFKGDLWLELALKRALLYASENGYDAVSWARGDQIAKAVGGDAEALSVQYDQKIGRFLSKYTKKWGGKVEEDGLTGIDEEPLNRIAGESDLLSGEESIILRTAERSWDRSLSTEENIARMPKAQAEAVRKLLSKSTNPILSITPEMRASVLEGQPLAIRRPQTQASEPEALGQTDPYNMAVSIAMQAVEAEAAAKKVSPVQEAVRVLRHEAIEFFNAVGMFTQREWKLLTETARKQGWIESNNVNRVAYEATHEGMDPAALEELLVKEAIAEQYSEYHLGRKEFDGKIADLFRRIRNFITRVANAARGQGFQTWGDVFTRIDAGEFKARFDEAFAEMQAARDRAEGPQAVVRAGQLPDAQGFTPTPGAPGPVIGLSQQVRNLKRSLGMTVRQGRLDATLKRQARAAGGTVGGQFDRSTGVTRLAVSNDFDSLAHEGGHHLESKFGQKLEAIKNQFAAELTPLASPGPDALSEGFAEWFRRYVTNPSSARNKAPGFHRAFEEFLNAEDPLMLGQLLDIQQGYEEFLKGDPTEIKVANQTVLKGRENAFTRFMRDAEENSVFDTMSDRLHNLYFNMIAKNHGWWMATKQALDLIERNTGQRVDLKAVDNPNKILRRINHTTAWAMQDLKRGIATKAKPNGGGISMHDILRTAFGGTEQQQWNDRAAQEFGDYLISRRAINLYIRHLPQLRQDVLAFIQANPSLAWLRARLPTNTESTLENAPTLEPLSLHLQSLLDHEQRNPQLRQAAEMYYQFNKDILAVLNEKGLLSDEDFAALSQDNDYAPFQRDMSDQELATGARASRRPGTDGATANKYAVYRAIKGSTRDIINPIQSTVQFVYEMRLRAALNDTLQAMDRLSRAAGPGGGAIFERLPANEAKGYTVQIQDALKNAAKDAGLSDYDTAYMLGNVESYLGDSPTTMMFTQQQAKERGERIVWFYENGKPVPARLADGSLGQMMFEGFTTMGRRSADLWMKVLAFPALAVRVGVTGAFEFIFRNIFIDGLVAPVNSPYAVMPWGRQAAGLSEVVKGGAQQQMYNRYAGMMGGEMTQAISDQSTDRDIESLRKQGFKISRPRNLMELAKTIFRLGEFTETGTRVGIFKAAAESAAADGLSEYEAAAEAAYAAHDVIDFSRHGSKTEVLRRAIPFWNAAMQGTDRYVRSLTAQGDHGSAIMTYIKYRSGQKLTASEKQALGHAAKAWFYTTVVFGGMSYFFSMLNEGDDDVDEVPDRIKATHWVVSVGGALHLIPKDIRTFLDLPEDSDILLRLPKGFETAWFANGVERALDAAKKEDPTAFNNYLNDLWEITKPPGGIPAIDLPYELIMGKSLFTGRSIIPYWEQELERSEQYGPYTSVASREIGDAINVSPYYVDHFIRGAGASVARDVQTVIDFTSGKGPMPGIEEYPIARRFTYNTGRFSRSLEKFYDLRSDKEGFNSWFWDTAKGDARSFNSAKATYKRFVDAGNEAAASDLYERMNDDQKVFATLGVHFTDSKSKYRNLHPIENADEGIKVAGAVMKEVYSGTLLVGKKEERTALDREKMRFARNELGHIRKGFAQNALHILGVPGWSNQPMVDVGKRLDTLKAGAPEVYDEFMRRLYKEKFVDFKHLARAWPEVKERVLAEKDRAILGDLYAGGRTQRTYATQEAGLELAN